MTAQTYLMRIWLPDRPGVLGAVATRLGAVNGDLLGIEIVERGGGMVIDELLISLPTETVIGLMIREVTSVDGVRIEDVKTVEATRHPEELALEASAAIAEWPLTHPAVAGDLADHICDQLMMALRCSWVAIVDQPGQGASVLATHGDAPDASWLLAYCAGAHHARSTTALRGTEPSGSIEVETDTFCVHLDRSDQMLVLGRDESSFLQGDRNKAQILGRVADMVSAFHRPKATTRCDQSPTAELLTTPSR